MFTAKYEKKIEIFENVNLFSKKSVDRTIDSCYNKTEENN